ncbi:MAG: hypothetical protein ABR567_12755 [Myxococcales bacterium]|nr:hypothetical protein [Myxococcales bacterium]
MTPMALNQAVDRLNTQGRYLEALALAGQLEGRERDTCSEMLVQINCSEAEYNLGRWGAAWERLRGLDPIAAMFPIARAGLAQQRAWIAAHTRRPDEALRQLGRADLRDLPRPYHAEHYFTAAVASLAAGRLDDARRHALSAADLAIRTSSRRNALFIRARVAAAQGDWARAESLCRTAASHSYRAQGGDGLVLWGDALMRLGHPDEAWEAWELAIERDPQSENARFAAERLQTVTVS